MADGVFYGGQALPLDINSQIERFVSSRWPASRWPAGCDRLDHPLRSNPFANREAGTRFALPYPDVPSPRINEVIIPTGASRYGRGLFLIGGDELDALVGSSASEDADYRELRIEYGGTSFTWQMAHLTPVLIDATGRDALWLLPLVDARYFWRQLPANSPVARTETWESLFTDLGAAIGETLTPGSVAMSHGNPDIESFEDKGLSATQAIDVAALSIGLRPVMQSDGSLTLEDASTANTALTSNLAAVTPWLGGASDHYGLPKTLSLVTRKAFDLYGLFGETAITEETIDAEGNTLGDVTIHSPRWLEHYSGLEDSASRASADNLAATMASIIAGWGNKQHTISVPGVAGWTVCGHDDFLSIYVPGLDRTESVSTHALSLPSDFFPIVHLGNVDYQLNFSRVRGIAVGAAGPGEDIEIQTLVGMDGTTDGISRNLTVDNTHDWDVSAGATVRAEYNETDRVWEAYQVDCPATGG